MKRAAFDVLTENHLLPGTEDGSEDFISHIVYNEGRMSPFCLRYRAYECGREKAQLRLDAHAEAHFQCRMVNPRLRVLLWELVYRDCVVSYPYWGDATNACPATMRDKSLFGALYAVSPLFSFFAGDWPRLKPDILSAYHAVTSVVRMAKDSPMTDFEDPSQDRLVQRTSFEIGLHVTVNFYDEQRVIDGVYLAPKSINVTV